MKIYHHHTDYPENLYDADALIYSLLFESNFHDTSEIAAALHY